MYSCFVRDVNALQTYYWKSVNIQIISKVNWQYKVVKTIWCANTNREKELLMLLANTELERLQGMQGIFVEHDDLVVDNFVDIA